MEKITNRDKFFHNFYEFCQKVDLNPELIDALSKHHIFSDDMKTVLKFGDKSTQKALILAEFTRYRSTCKEMVRLLRSLGQTEAADELKKYNTSPGRMKITNEVEIKVTQGKAPFIGSNIYSMTKNPRGKCIIINNIRELFKESQRFEHIFKELYFDVEPIENTCEMTAQQISDKLESVAKDKSLTKHEALLVIVISHGEDERVLGYNACRELKDEKFDESDVIKISEIVDIFAEKKCIALRQTPKMFFFNCCRIKTYDALKPTADVTLPASEMQWTEEIPENNEIEINLTAHEERVFVKLNTIDQQWVNENKDTFISYSCSEGYKTYYNSKKGITEFGQALSHSIAQYACEESLQSIMSRTCDFMDKNESEEYRSAPELRGQCMRRQLFFNPGFYKPK